MQTSLLRSDLVKRQMLLKSATMLEQVVTFKHSTLQASCVEPWLAEIGQSQQRIPGYVTDHIDHVILVF